MVTPENAHITINSFLDKHIKNLPKVGDTIAKKLEKLEVFTIRDLLYHFPFRYEDMSIITPVSAVQPKVTVTIKGEVVSISNTVTKNGKRLTVAKINDGSGDIQAVWFNQFYLSQSLPVGTRVSLSGSAEWFGKKLSLFNPSHEITLEGRNLHTGRIVPVYPETYGLTSKWIRTRISEILKIYMPILMDHLPDEIKRQNNLWGLSQALEQIHFPLNMENALKARERLGFDEMLLSQLTSAIRRHEWRKQAQSFSIMVDQQKHNEFLKALPFILTNAQQKVIGEIFTDLEKTDPANRLIQGDVGSGKTVVAAAAAFAVNQSTNPAHPQKLKTILMAPTEILARQHHKLLENLLGDLGLKVVLQTGSFKGLKKADNYDVLVGTHALIADKVELDNIGLIVVDEQHRFGVEQRNLLRKKSESAHKGEAYVPHFLTMTATPIPRTLALTIYGDLDLSVIDELPENRQEIKTYVVPPTKRDGAYGFVAKQLEQGRQAFVICPFIEPSESMGTVKSALVEFERLQEIFGSFKLGILHGRLKSKEKDDVMSAFKNGDLDMLVATPVVEVGIDIPNATAILIESAERFGLASLHQLRGRVGRGEHHSFCLLFTENDMGPSFDRLKMMEKHHIGLELAEIDMQMRGSGDIVGTAQSGRIDFKIADLTDTTTIEKTQKLAQTIIEQDPTLTDHPSLRYALVARENQNVSPD